MNTLFVTTQGAYLNKEGETIVVRADNNVLIRLPIHTISGIVCFGNVLASPFLLGFCAENGVGVSFLTEYGRFLFRVQGAVSGNVLLRREQYRRADDKRYAAGIARTVVMAKISNSRTGVQRTLRDHQEKVDTERLKKVVEHLAHCARALRNIDNFDGIRGIEGDAAQNYFGVFNQMIVAQKEDFRFVERNRRPPLDRVNCLLSFVYTLLMHDVRSALEGVGLDPTVGFLHTDRPGRPSLALDIMEEFRAYIADRLVLSLINLRQMDAKGFRIAENGAVLMDDESRKILLAAYQERKREEIMHPFLEEKVAIGLLFYVQALLLARYLRGDLDAYPPFIWR